MILDPQNLIPWLEMLHYRNLTLKTLPAKFDSQNFSLEI